MIDDPSTNALQSEMTRRTTLTLATAIAAFGVAMGKTILTAGAQEPSVVIKQEGQITDKRIGTVPKVEGRTTFKYRKPHSRIRTAPKPIAKESIGR